MKLKEQYITKTSEQRLYQCEVPLIGITGGIATGKSCVSQILRENSHPLIDADEMVKEVYQNQETIEFVQNNFPQVFKEGAIDFKTLRKIAFEDKGKKFKLESFIYSKLPHLFSQKRKELKDISYLFYDVPLLYEKNLEDKFDLVICVYAPRQLQIERIQSRDNSPIEVIKNILDNQLSIEDKKERADFILSNTEDYASLKEKVLALLKQILK